MFAETLHSRRVGRVCLALVLPSPTGWALACPQAELAASHAVTACHSAPGADCVALSCDDVDSLPIQSPPALPSNVEAERDDTLERPSHELATAQAVFAILTPMPRCVELASREAHTAQGATSPERCVALCRWII